MSDQAEWGGHIVEWARRFHVEYEYQAKRFGWESQAPVDFDDLPEANRQTMLCTVAAVMGSEVYPRERLIEAVTAERDALLAEAARLRSVIERVAECVCFFDHKTVKGLKTDVLAILDEQPAPIFTAMGLDEPEFPTIRKDDE